jgi:hypothetical protein
MSRTTDAIDAEFADALPAFTADQDAHMAEHGVYLQTSRATGSGTLTVDTYGKPEGWTVTLEVDGWFRCIDCGVDATRSSEWQAYPPAP